MLRFTRWFGVIFFFRPLSLPWIKWPKIRDYLFQNPETQRPPDVWDQTRLQLSSQCQWQRHAGSPDLMRWWFGAQGIQCWEIQRWRIEIHFIYCQLEFFFFGGDKSLIAGHGLSHQLQRILQGNPDPELVSHAKNNYQCFFVSSCLLILKEQVSDFVFAYWDCKHDICHKLYVKGS